MDSVQYRPPTAYQDVSNTNHFGHCDYWTVIGELFTLHANADSLGWLAASSQCMASITKAKLKCQHGITISSIYFTFHETCQPDISYTVLQ